MSGRRLVAVGTASLLLALSLTGATPASAAPAGGPSTTITAGPSGLLSSRSATFRFRAGASGSTFQCRLDAKPWARCSSPRRYTGLAQGAHTFRVRGVRSGAADPSPATRSFRVDTIRPQTTLLSGPSGVTDDPTPTFTFTASEPSTFQCRTASTAPYAACSSPYTPESLDDGAYQVQVRARDRAGNVDATPASRTLSVERVLTADLAGATIVAELALPDRLVLDVAPICTGDPVNQIDCLNDVALPGSDQLAIASERTVGQTGPARFTMTVVSDIATLRPVLLTWRGLDCATGLTSAHGDDPAWTITADIVFDTDPGSGQTRATLTEIDVSGVELADWGVGSFGCGAPGTFTSTYVADAFRRILGARVEALGNPLCAPPGPVSYGACTGGPPRSGAPTQQPRSARTSMTAPDTSPPDTVASIWPWARFTDLQPSITFTSEEGATFECRLVAIPFAPCTSGVTPVDLVPDTSYVFEVRARDASGNVDPTPAVVPFSRVAELSYSQETGDAVAEYLLPDDLLLDVPAICTGDVRVDCPGGTPLPAADQLSLSSTRTVLRQGHSGARYDLTASSTVRTLSNSPPVVLEFSGARCDLTFDSTAGTTPTWSLGASLDRIVQETFGEPYLSRRDVSVTGLEQADYTLSGGFVCGFGSFFPVSMAHDLLTEMVAARIPSTCLAPGSAVFEPCPWAG